MENMLYLALNNHQSVSVPFTVTLITLDFISLPCFQSTDLFNEIKRVAKSYKS